MSISGPLAGLRVIEFAGLGPAPFCAMLLASLGAQVLRIDRPGGSASPTDITSQGRPTLRLDLKQADAAERALQLIEQADLLIEGFRPGVMERLGVGPEPALARQPALIYGRMTGWGQTGPRAQEPGHDINYLALTGALHAIGPRERPVIPANLVADFGGGALYLAFGLLAARHEAARTGRGQVVDCAMVDGVASLMSMLYGHLPSGYWLDQREANTIDGASHFYNVYQCLDGLWLAVGAVEPQFYANLLDILDLAPADFPQRDRALWPRQRARFAAIFSTRSRAEWLARCAGRDACVTPVLSMHEAPLDPHNLARGTFRIDNGNAIPAAAPRFSAHAAPTGAPDIEGWGLSVAERATLTSR